MIIKPSDVKVPLKKVVTTIGGNFEVSLSKRSNSDSEAYQEFVAAYVAEVEGSTIEQAAAQFNEYEDVILESAEAGELTPAQKKLPPFMQKMMLKKMGKGKGHPDAENKKEQAGENKDSEKKEESAKAKVATKAKMIDEETGEPLDDETSECAMKDKKAKAATQEKTKTLSKKDETPTCPACESLNVGKAAGMKKKVCATCK
jgi:hypothetical protein